jgi:hypothetical protein
MEPVASKLSQDPEALRSREAKRQRQAEPGDMPSGLLDPAGLARLQRSAGNAAVSLLVQRSRAGAPHARPSRPRPLGSVALTRGPIAPLPASEQSTERELSTAPQNVESTVGGAAYPLPPLTASPPYAEEAASETPDVLGKAGLATTASRQLTLQRDATTDTLHAGEEARDKTPAGAPGGVLTDGERIDLRRLTGERIRDCNLPFRSACDEKKAELREAAKQQGETITMICEIAFGLLAPGLGSHLSKMVEEIPVNKPIFKKAIKALDEEQAASLFEAASKPGLKALNDSWAASSGDRAVDKFLKDLKENFRIGADAISNGLKDRTDNELGVLWAAYDPRIASDDAYKEAVESLVSKFQTQIEPIGTTDYLWMNKTRAHEIYWVVFPNKSKKLALLESESGGDKSVEQWISPEFTAMAIEKYKATPNGRYYKGVVQEIASSKIGMSAGDIIEGSMPRPPTAR